MHNDVRHSHNIRSITLVELYLHHILCLLSLIYPQGVSETSYNVPQTP